MREIDLKQQHPPSLPLPPTIAYLWLSATVVMLAAVALLARLLGRLQPLNELARHLANRLRHRLVRVPLRRLLMPTIERLLLHDVLLVQLQQDLRHRLLVAQLAAHVLALAADERLDGVQQVLLTFAVLRAQLPTNNERT